VIGGEHPFPFLSGNRALSSILSSNVKLLKHFEAKYGGRFRTVRDYFLPNQDRVILEDVSKWCLS
jgi:hypothetical protein